MISTPARAFRPTRLVTAGLTAFAILLAGLAAPQARAAANREQVQAFLQVTGFDVALDSIRLSAADGPAMLGLEASDFGMGWTILADEVFDVDVMKGLATDILTETLEPEVLDHAADFYASDLGARLVEAENESHMSERDDKRGQGEEMVASMDAERVAALKRMMEAVSSGDSSIRAMQEIEIRFLLAADAAGVIELRVDEDMLRAQAAERLEELRGASAESGLAASAWTYRDFSTEEITAYAVALEDPKMQEVYELMNAVQWQVMADRFEVLAGRMSELQMGEEL